jgi:hypothetical protein
MLTMPGREARRCGRSLLNHFGYAAFMACICELAKAVVTHVWHLWWVAHVTALA